MANAKEEYKQAAENYREFRKTNHLGPDDLNKENFKAIHLVHEWAIKLFLELHNGCQLNEIEVGEQNPLESDFPEEMWVKEIAFRCVSESCQKEPKQSISWPVRTTEFY